MKKALEVEDLLGERPTPLSGDLQPRSLDEALGERAAMALAACQGVWVSHDPQEAVIRQIRAYLRAWSLVTDKASCGGRRLSQYSQAGKSATMRRLRRVLAQQARERGEKPNKHEVVIVTLKKRLSLTGLYRLILKQLGDPHFDQQRILSETLLKRIEEHSARLGMRLLVIDEVQHLDNATRDAMQILEQMKTFVDEALFPVVFVGDEASKDFFERNGKFAARLGDPLQLEPLRPLSSTVDAAAFKRFCGRYDAALQRREAVGAPAGLTQEVLLNGLLLASGGHVGRVARILQVAVPHAVWRGARTVEAYDLSHAVRGYAMKNGWIGYDPFSKRSA